MAQHTPHTWALSQQAAVLSVGNFSQKEVDDFPWWISRAQTYFVSLLHCNVAPPGPALHSSWTYRALAGSGCAAECLTCTNKSILSMQTVFLLKNIKFLLILGRSGLGSVGENATGPSAKGMPLNQSIVPCVSQCSGIFFHHNF